MDNRWKSLLLQSFISDTTIASRCFKVENFDLKTGRTRRTYQILAQSLHRKRPVHACHHPEKPQGRADHHRHCGDLRQNPGIVRARKRPYLGLRAFIFPHVSLHIPARERSYSRLNLRTEAVKPDKRNDGEKSRTEHSAFGNLCYFCIGNP